MNWLSNVPEMSITRFEIHHLYHKDQLINNLTKTFICTINYFNFLYNFLNISANSRSIYNISIYTT